MFLSFFHILACSVSEKFARVENFQQKKSTFRYQAQVLPLKLSNIPILFTFTSIFYSLYFVRLRFFYFSFCLLTCPPSHRLVLLRHQLQNVPFCHAKRKMKAAHSHIYLLRETCLCIWDKNKSLGERARPLLHIAERQIDTKHSTTRINNQTVNI